MKEPVCKEKAVAPGFWGELPRPILALAPMDDVTDAPFRRMVAKYGKPDVMFGEFVSVDGLCSVGRKNLLRDLIFDPSEHPVVAQLFGTDPQKFCESARLIRDLGFDGVDVNMGCPVKLVCKTGAGASLIKTPSLAKEIVLAAKEGAGQLPVSVKTRTGFERHIMDEWLATLLEVNPAAITLHLRTAREMSKVDAHWELAARAVDIVGDSPTVLIGNGDIESTERARALAAETGLDGIMLGRAVFGNPWLFGSTKVAEVPLSERLRVMVEHAELFEEVFGSRKRFVVMRKHLLAYSSGFSGAKELRIKLMQANSAEEVKQIVASSGLQ